MVNSTLLTIPSDITNATELRRFLSTIIERLDTIVGARGEQISMADLDLPLVTPGAAYVQAEATTVANQVQEIQSTVNNIQNVLRTIKTVS